MSLPGAQPGGTGGGGNKKWRTAISDKVKRETGNGGRQGEK